MKIDYLQYYIGFLLLYYSHALFYGGGQSFRRNTSLAWAISRDLIWLLFLFITVLIYYKQKNTTEKETYEVWEGYRRFCVYLMLAYVSYALISLSHLSHKNYIDILHHDFRNIMMYMPIIFFMPVWITSSSDIKKYVNTFLFLGGIVSIFGIISKVLPYPFLTWDGRIVSTLSDPNNLAFFLNLMIFILVSNISLSTTYSKKSLLGLLVFLIALSLTDSLTIFASFFLGILLIMVILRRRLVFNLSIILLMVFLIFNSYIGNLFPSIKNEENRAVKLLKNKEKEDLPSIRIRMEQIKVFLHFLSVAPFYDKMLGDRTLTEYKTHDSQYLNIIRNNGILTFILLFTLFFSLIPISYAKYKLFLVAGDIHSGSLCIAFSAFMITTLFVSFNSTAFLNRFPLSFIFYFFSGLIIFIRPKGPESKNVIVLADTDTTAIGKVTV